MSSSRSESTRSPEKQGPQQARGSPPWRSASAASSENNNRQDRNSNRRSHHDSNAPNINRSKPRYYNEATRTLYPSRPIREITPSYTTISLQDPVTLTTPKKILVVLDLNGTLFYRSKNNTRTVTSRPHLDTFLDFLFRHCRVMVWSSAKPHNVQGMLSFGFGNRIPLLDRIWSRDNFRLPQKDYEAKVLTVKDLEFIWEGIRLEKEQALDPKDEKYLEEFDQTNTVLIDDSTAKSQLQPHNGLVLTDFTQELAKAGDDIELLKVKNYLSRLIYQENVSAYMRVHPFNSDKESAHPSQDESEEKEEKVKEDVLAMDKALDDLADKLEKNTL